MLYRPHFCCNCGEKIERDEWPLFASGKFCDVCRAELRLSDWTPKVIISLAALMAFAVISSFFQSDRLPAHEVVSTLPPPAPVRLVANSNTTPSAVQQSQTGPSVNSNSPSAVETAPVRPVPAIKTTEAVYFCGAATKKGTPCSRRVKKPGERCWQHAGMPAMDEAAVKAAK
jgi:hypothetical protein